jgi:hypothetical protein
MTTTAPERTPGTHDVEPVMPGGPVDEFREEALASLKRKRRFAENLVGYATVNGALWLIWLLTDRSTDGGMPWPAWVSAIWGFFLVMDAWRAFGRWPAALHQPITEADIERELTRTRRL